MKRNSTTLFIQSPGAVTPVPWINSNPDFSGFTEPTLSVLQSSWQEFLDSGAELEIVPDPEPIVESPAPNWDGLYKSFIASQSYRHLTELELSFPPISTAMGKIADAIQYGIFNPQSQAALPAFQASIDLLFLALEITGQSLSESLLTEVRNVLNNNNFQPIILP